MISINNKLGKYYDRPDLNFVDCIITEIIPLDKTKTAVVTAVFVLYYNQITVSVHPRLASAFAAGGAVFSLTDHMKTYGRRISMIQCLDLNIKQMNRRAARQTFHKRRSNAQFHIFRNLFVSLF